MFNQEVVALRISLEKGIEFLDVGDESKEKA